MYTIIICGILGAIIGFLVISNIGQFSFSDLYFLLPMSLLTGMLGGMVGMLIALLITIFIPAETHVVETTYNIETLQDNSTISGSFFLGSGQFNGDMKYVFYYENNGLYKMKQLPYELVSIKYSDVPKVTQYQTVVNENSLINKFNLGCGCNHKLSYIIEVPKGTIINNYTLDAK